jgi:hypothetical protein
MGIELLLVLLLQTEDDLAWHDALLRPFELQSFIQRGLRGVFVHVRRHLLFVDNVLGNDFLIDAYRGQRIQRPGVNLFPPVRDGSSVYCRRGLQDQLRRVAQASPDLDR